MVLLRWGTKALIHKGNAIRRFTRRYWWRLWLLQVGLVIVVNVSPYPLLEVIAFILVVLMALPLFFPLEEKDNNAIL